MCIRDSRGTVPLPELYWLLHSPVTHTTTAAAATTTANAHQHHQEHGLNNKHFSYNHESKLSDSKAVLIPSFTCDINQNGYRKCSSVSEMTRKSELLLVRRARTYSSSCSQVILVIGSALTTVGRFLLPDQLTGTHCLMTYVIQNVLQTFSDSRWRRFCFHSTSAYSALEVLTIMHYINLHLTFDISPSISSQFTFLQPKIAKHH